MKTIFSVFGLAVFTFSAVAQDVPQMETFLGYTYLRANSATNVPAYSQNGGSGQFGYNFNKWLSGVVDIGATHNNDIGGFQIDNTFTNAMLGPRFSLRYSRVRPYVEILFGAVHGSASALINPPYLVVATPLVTTDQPVQLPSPIENRPVSARFVTSQTAYAMALGGGLDIKMNKHVSFRPIGLDWFMTRLQNLRSLENNNQDNLRYTTGFNFTFGAQ